MNILVGAIVFIEMAGLFILEYIYIYIYTHTNYKDKWSNDFLQIDF